MIVAAMLGFIVCCAVLGRTLGPFAALLMTALRAQPDAREHP